MNLKDSTFIVTILVVTSSILAFGAPVIPDSISNSEPIVDIEDIKLENISVLSEEIISFTGTENYSLMGISVSNAGDVNNDGFDDVIIGAPSHETYGVKGNAYIYFGGYRMDNIKDVILTGEAPGDIFGQSVSTAGDVNGDGYGDVIIGAPFNDPIGYNSGKVYIYYGGDPMDNVPDLIMTGNEFAGTFGFYVSNGGDLNNDGFDDVLVASPNANTKWDIYPSPGYSYGRGNVSIFFGGNPMDNVTDLVITYVPQPYTGGDTGIWDISCAGDVNNDGFDDVIIGRPFEDYSGGSGRAYIYLGGSVMDNSSDLILTGEGGYDRFGNGVAGAGDVNNDGYDDLIIGAPEHDIEHSPYSGIGRAYVYYGGNPLDDTPDVIFDAEAINPDDLYGWAVSGAGDVDNDGYDDVIVGASHCNEGRAYVYYGGESMDNVSDITMVGEDIWDQFGFSISTAGDTNKDGYDEVIIGAHTNVPEDEKRGKAYLRISPYVVANEGDELQFFGNFMDPDVGDTHTIEWDFGDGNTASGNLTPLHTYGDDGVYNPSLTVTDSQGCVGTKSVQVIVNNVAPNAEAGGPYYGYVGNPVNITGSCYDPGYLDTHTYDWDMDRNGYFGDRRGDITSWTWNAEGRYYIILKVTDDDGGLGYDQATVNIQPLNRPPVADAGVDQFIYEGETVFFNGNGSLDPDGDPLEYSWDFNNYADSDDNGNTTDDTDAIDPNPSHAYGDDGVYTVTLTVTDTHGATDTDTCMVTVLNLGPTTNIEAVYMNVEIGLRVTGRKYNDVGMTLYEDGNPIGDVSIERRPGSPDAQMEWIPITLDMTKSYSVTVFFIPEDPPNIGANPVWVYIKLENGSIRKIHHTFNVQQSIKRNSEHWNLVEPWEVDINHYLMGYEVTLEASAGDPGSDDLTFDWSFGTTIAYYNNGVTPDPYPSPEGIYPFSVIVMTNYSYTGSETTTLTVIDDDGGTYITSIDIA